MKDAPALSSAELESVAGGFTKAQVGTKLGYFAGSQGQLDGPVSIGAGSRTALAGGGHEYKFKATTGDEAAVQFYKGSAIAKCPDSKISHCALSLSPAASNWGR